MKLLPLILILLCGCASTDTKPPTIPPAKVPLSDMQPPSVINAPPIPTLVRDAIDFYDWRVIFPDGAVTTNFTWQAQFATNLTGPWMNFGEWWDGDANIVKMQPTLFLRLVGFTNQPPKIPKAVKGLIGS